MGLQRRHDLFRHQFNTAQVVLHGKAAVLTTVRLHQIGHVVFAAHVNANE